MKIKKKFSEKEVRGNVTYCNIEFALLCDN